MSWTFGVGVFIIGLISLFIGIILLILEREEEGAIETKWGVFAGPVWFIFMIFGIVMMIVGWLMPF